MNEEMYPGITPQDRRSLDVKAIRQSNVLRTQTMDDLVARRANDEILTWKDDLEPLVKRKILKATQAEYLLDEQARSGDDPATNERGAMMLTAIDAYNPTNDPNNTQITQLGLDLVGLPAFIKSEGERRLKAKTTRTATEANRSTADARLASIYNSGHWGSLRKFQGTPLNAVEYNEANKTFAQEKAALSQWIDEHPKAGEKEILDYVELRYNAAVTTVGKEDKGNPIFNYISGIFQ